MSKKSDDLLTVKEVAKICKVSPITATWWMRDGRLPAKRMGWMWVAKRGDVDQFKRTRRDKYPVGHPFKDKGNGKD